MDEKNKPLLSGAELADLLAPMDEERDSCTILLHAGSITLNSEDLHRLAKGTELELTPPASGRLELQLDGQCIGHAEPIPGNRPRIRITRINIPPGFVSKE